MKKIVAVIIILLTIGGLYFFVFSPWHYKVLTPTRSYRVIVKGASELSLGQSLLPANGNSGICAPPGCGAPEGPDREWVNLGLNDAQLTSLLNQLKPTAVLLSDMKVGFKGKNILVSGISYYPFFPGKISGTARLDIKHFYVNDVYVGGVKVPEKVARFVESNVAGLIEKLQMSYGVWIEKMDLIDEKLALSLNVPKGMVVIEKDGTIVVDLSKAKPFEGPSGAEVRF